MFFTITLTVLTSSRVEVSLKIARARKRTTNCTTIMSFLCTVLLSNIVLNQPAREESLIYCKNWLIDSLESDFLSPNKQTHKKRNNYIPFSSCVSNQYVTRVSCCEYGVCARRSKGEGHESSVVIFFEGINLKFINTFVTFYTFVCRSAKNARSRVKSCKQSPQCFS